MNRLPDRSCVAILGFLLLFVTRARSEEQRRKTTDKTKTSNERVQKLFTTMRDGKYKDSHFPELKREDIPALLEVSWSVKVVEIFPWNPISSQCQRRCSERMVAFWLVGGA